MKRGLLPLISTHPILIDTHPLPMQHTLDPKHTISRTRQQFSDEFLGAAVRPKEIHQADSRLTSI